MLDVFSCSLYWLFGSIPETAFLTQVPGKNYLTLNIFNTQTLGLSLSLEF